VRIEFADRAWEDYLYWQANAPNVLARVNDLIRECRRTPFKGIGKPEPLKEKLKGWWSRRITDSDRLVYRVCGKPGAQTLQIAQCRFHYE
jgi:toxin YoeB